MTYETFTSLARERDFFTAIEHLQSAGTPVEIAKAYHTLMLDAYWKHKDLPCVVRLAPMGIGFCFTHAHRDPALQTELLGVAKGMAYDLGSFTWPGWDEPGISPTAADT